MHEKNTITNEMLYEFLKEFKQYTHLRFDQHDKRFDQHDKRFDQHDRQYGELKEELKDIKHILRHHEDRINDLHETRNRVTVNFTKAWAGASFGIALISSLLTLIIAKSV